MSESNPWADPNSPTEPGAPYAGPPTTGRPSPAPHVAPGYGTAPGYGPAGYSAPPPGYGPPGYGPPGYAAYGYAPGYAPGYPPPWPPASARPRRPGQVIAAAVLAFVQGGLVLLASVYVVFLASFAGIAADADPSSAPDEVASLATEGVVLGFVQVASAVLLIVGGVMALNTRRRRALIVLVAAFGVQVLLCVYWAVRLTALADDIPGGDPSGAFLAFTLLFAASPLVGLGLVLLGAGRRWFDEGVPMPTPPDTGERR